MTRQDRRRSPTPSMRRLVRKRLGVRCVYCGVLADHLDHVIPWSRGGRTHPNNLVPACTLCGTTKGARTPEEWLGEACPSWLAGGEAPGPTHGLVLAAARTRRHRGRGGPGGRTTRSRP